MTRQLKYAVGVLFDFLSTTAEWLQQCAENVQMEDNLAKYIDVDGKVKLPGGEKYHQKEDIITMRQMFKLRRTKFHTRAAKEIEIRQSDRMGVRPSLTRVR